MSTGQAPGKAILLGEHAVVYGFPALAVPIPSLQATVTVERSAPDSGLADVRFEAPDIGLSSWLCAMEPADPLPTTLRLTLQALGRTSLDPARILIQSDIPPASGLGSGTAVTLALIRAICAFVGRSLPLEQQSEIAYEVEKIHHGSPSGIDNTVITFAQPILFRKGQAPTPLQPARPIPLILADCGVASSTAAAVAHVRQQLTRLPQATQALFETIGNLVETATIAFQSGDLEQLGRRMSENHSALQELGVSNAGLDAMVDAACAAGALGAKLSGAGQGGHIVALAREHDLSVVERALRGAGARTAVRSEVGA
jgi:mevalonate kinase